MTKFAYDAYSPTQMLATDLAYDHESMMRSLIRFRIDKGLTRGNVADMLGVPDSEIEEFEEVRNPTLREVRLYALAVGARIETKVTT